MDAKTPDLLRDESRPSERPKDDAPAKGGARTEQPDKPQATWKDTLRQHPYWIAVAANLTEPSLSRTVLPPDSVAMTIPS